jgi:subtilisin family serine protease
MLTPRVRPREPSQIGALAIVALTATLALLFAAGHRDGLKTEPASAAASGWIGLVGERGPKVRDTVSQWRIVVLKAPSLATRVAAAGGSASEAQERRWSTQASAAQKRLLSRLALQGVRISIEFGYTRVLNGFSAVLDPQAIALLEHAPEVQGVYPVRAGYPASVSSSLVRKAMRNASAAARPPGLALSGSDGKGVTIALLDTGVDRFHPYFHGHVEAGSDVVSGAGPGVAQPNPSAPTDFERHGTEMAGVLVGHGGPYGLEGIAPGATVLPLRVAGWQHDDSGGWAVYGRSDQLIAGLEEAVDPNGDGDAHDAARVALVGLAEPYISFSDAPEARAVDGALALDTLVVAPAGNDLPAGPAFGSISGPGGARSALTVGAADLRRETEQVQVAIRVGLDIKLSRALPLAGAFAPDKPLDIEVAAPRGASTQTPRLADFFGPTGNSIVAGRAALVPAGASPEAAVEGAAQAGAYAILVYGNGLPAGALGLDENVIVPVIAFPDKAAQALLASIASGKRVSVSIGKPQKALNAAGFRIAGFSSRGLAYDGRVKPDLAGPGVTIPTAEPGTNEDGTARFGTVNGTSVAAAGIAGAAALLAQARPSLTASDLMGLLTGSSRPLAGDPIIAQGAGLVDLAAASAAEISAHPATLALPPAGSKSRTVRWIVLRNVSNRRVRVKVSGAVGGEAFSLALSPRRLSLRADRTAALKVVARTPGRLPRTFEGAITITPSRGAPIRVPWVAARRPRGGLLSHVSLSSASFDPARVPTFLSVVAGRLPRAGSPQVEPVARLEIALWTKKGKRLGLLSKVRDLLPSSSVFQITGRAPTGQILAPGVYRLVVRAYPTAPGPASRKVVEFRIEK